MKKLIIALSLFATAAVAGPFNEDLRIVYGYMIGNRADLFEIRLRDDTRCVVLNVPNGSGGIDCDWGAESELRGKGTLDNN